MRRMKIVLAIVIAGALIATLHVHAVAPAFAITAGPHPMPLEEVPIERLLRNIERNRDQPRRMYQYWVALARVHLLAYIRQTKTLPAYVRRLDGKEDASAYDGPFVGCEPIARPKDTEPKPVSKCLSEDMQFNYPAPRGLPVGTLAVRNPVDDHLKAAVRAYQYARAMKPTLIRPRLALAYGYDRLGQIDKALTELRYIIDAATSALPRVQSDRNFPGEFAETDSYWDYQIVAAEAIEHLMMISKDRADLERIRKLRPRLKTPKKMMLYMTPIFVPLTDAKGIKSFVDPTPHVTFDFTGQGLRLKGGWITKEAAWLVWDPVDKRNITSGFQLFGSVTWLTPWENGYLALAALDDNGDGRIAGPELKGLSLWRDANANGVSDKGEVKPVADWQITALGYRHKRQSKDAWISEAGVTFANGETRPTYDWNIRTQLVTAQKQ